MILSVFYLQLYQKKTIKVIKNVSYTKIYQGHIPCSFAYQVVCVDNKFSKDVVIYRGKNAADKFIEEILEEYKYCRKVIKKHFNKNLMSAEEEEEEEKFQLDNSCWISDKLFDVGDEKVTDHCHMTEKLEVLLILVVILKTFL